MAEIVILNGPPGVGKTTVSRILTDLLPGTVCIRGDDLRAFAPAKASEFLGGGSTVRAAAVLAKAYLAMGAARVVLDYVFLRPAHVAYFRDELGELPTPVFMFTLWAPLAVVQSRDRERAARVPVDGAVERCWHEMASNEAALGEFLDNTAVEPAEMARRIADRIAALQRS